MYTTILVALRWMCDSILNSTALMDQISEGNYDLMVIDVYYITRCFYIIPYKFNVPYVGFSTQYDAWSYR